MVSINLTIPAAVGEQINLGYGAPATIHVESIANRESKSVLLAAGGTEKGASREVFRMAPFNE